MAVDPGALIGRHPDAVLFHAPGRAPVTAATLLRAALRLADALPPGGSVINLCQERLPFVASFLAAVLRGRPSILATDRTPDALRALGARFPGAVAVRDAEMAVLPADEAGTLPAMPAIAPELPAAVVLTSGSTGAPVAHRKAWGALAARSQAIGAGLGIGDGACVVATVPPYHMYGFETSALLPLHAPAASWCGPAFYPADVQVALAAVPGPHMLVTTPLHLDALLRAPGRMHPATVVSATAPLDPDLAGEAERRWECQVLEIFGATEVGSIATRRTVSDPDWLPLPGLVLQPGDGEELLVGAPFAEPTLLADLVSLLPGGRFRLLGRRSDVVKLAGRRASLAGLSRVLAGLDGVQDAVFVAPEDPDARGARLLAFAVAPGRTADSLLAELRGRIDPVFLPRRVSCVERLPRNELGKLPRGALLALAGSAGT